jgi:5-methylcytosine-specific restriction endonuclease McrBC regulatory subunit McrC
VAKVDAAASEFSGLVVLLIDQFLDAVASYVASGRKFTYGRECAVGSLVGGKLDVVKSIRLRARGLGHLLAFERNATTYRTPLNKIILVALSELERLKTLIEIPLATISKSRGLSMIFADCRDFEVLHRERTYFAAEAMRLADVEDNELIRDISSLAGLILSRQSFDGVARPFPSSPRTWFLNLENLFERAVRNLLAGICVNARVTRGGKSPLAIFDVERNEYRANPDIVVVSPSEHIAVGDVKYKVFDGSAEAGDVYQLLVHAEAFGASKAFLIFPSDSFTCRTLGASRQGIDTFFFGVRLTYLADDLRKVADFLSLCCQADEPTEDDASELTKAANEETHEV